MLQHFSFSLIIAGIFLWLFQGAPTYAQVECGATVTKEVTLTDNLTCDTSSALIVLGPSGKLNLNGHTVSCNKAVHSVGIYMVGEEAILTNGTVINCHLGIVAGDQGRHHIIGVNAWNHANAGFSTSGVGTLGGTNGNRFINNHAEEATYGFLVKGNENLLWNNSSVETERGFVVSHNRNHLTLNLAKLNDIGFVIQVGAEKNHLLKNLAKENAFAGFEIEGSRNRLVDNRAFQNGHNMVDVGFRVIDANENFLGWNQSEQNTGVGFEILGLFARSERNVLRGNLARKNDQVGIALQLLAENNTVIENIGEENGTLDFQDANPDCDDNQWGMNTFKIGDPESCIR